MISIHDFYNVMSAVVPLYVAMILAYGSVKWWKLVTPEQCAGINRFVALFAVPLLSFQIISHNDPYNMSVQFIIADIIQKLIVLFVLGIWTRYSAKGSLEWFITLFMVSTLPNTLVMGIPLERAMYGKKSGGIVVQAVVLQCVLWYTLLLFLFEYRSAKILIMEQFPDTAGSIVSFKVDPDVQSLDGRGLVRTEAAVSEDGKIHVKVRRSTSSMSQEMNSVMSSWKSPGLTSMISSKAATPRASNLTGAEIYSLQSSRNMTPNGSSFNKTDFYSLMSTARGGSSPFVANSLFDPDHLQSSNHSSSIPTPKEPAHLEEGSGVENLNLSRYTSPEQSLNPSRNEKFGKGLEKKRTNTQEGMDDLIKTRLIGNVDSTSPKPPTKKAKSASRLDFDSKDLQMFVWSSSASPVSEKGSAFFGGQFFSANGTSKADSKIPTAQCTPEARNDGKNYLLQSHSRALGQALLCKDLMVGFVVTPRQPGQLRAYLHEDFSFVENVLFRKDNNSPAAERAELSFKGMASPLAPKAEKNSKGQTEMPPTAVMSRLILDMVWRKLIRNPNTYSSLFGIAWSLVSFRYNMAMPKIIENSITILSDAGLGMAMFSLGLFMALQPRLLACGKVMTIVAMVVRFVTGPAVMSATSIAIGMRDIPLKAAIIQAALPQGIVPFVFAKEYNVHPDILSTAVIVGMLVSLPISLLYYLLLNL